MLKVHPLSRPNEKREWLDKFDPRTSTFLVSDLKSKMEIQRVLLARHGCLEEDAVLRASELWRKLVHRLFPDVRVIQIDLARTLIRDWLDQRELSWARTAGAAQQLFQYTRQFLPILTHPNGRETLEPWFKENPESVIRWRHWLELSDLLWQHFLAEKVVPSTWLPGLLVNHQDLHSQWSRRLLVDLSAQITGEEVDLIQQLGRQLHVDVLAPAPPWMDQYHETQSHYLVLEGKATGGAIRREWGGAEKASHISYVRYSTMLAEVKAAVAQVRKWADGGVRLRNIAILAPDIEAYWPSLSAYLEQEGVSVDKPVVSRLQTLPVIQKWLALVRLRLADINSADLEVGTYALTRTQPIGFERFARLFTHIYDSEDLMREDRIAQLYSQEVAGDDLLSRDEFIAFAIRQWSEPDFTEPLETLVQAIFQDSPPPMRLRASLWRAYVESLCSRIEVKVARAGADGIHCLSMLSAEWLGVTHVFALGMSEQSLRQVEKIGLTHSEVESLARELGFRLPYPDKLQLEFEARWFMQRQFSQLILSCAATDYLGAPLSPSLMWLVESAEPKAALERVDSPQPTRWDEIQLAGLDEISRLREWPDDHARLMETAILQDLGSQPLANFAPPQGLALSASQLENYAECPFIFAAQKIFRLSDLPNLDLDVDAMTRGKLMHSLFERLTVEPFRSQWTADELRAALDEIYQRQDVALADHRLWPALREKYCELGRRFLAFESDWRRNYPVTRTVAREASVLGRWSHQARALVGEGEAAAGPMFRGAIDRVDSDGQGHYVIVDYKSSESGLTHHGSWVKNDSLQLALYAQAVEAGLTELPPGTVVGAVYYVAKTMNREKGFALVGSPQLLGDDLSRGLRLEPDGREELFKNINQRVEQLSAAITQGQFAPKPKKASDCAKCKWRWLCRSPHLN